MLSKPLVLSTTSPGWVLASLNFSGAISRLRHYGRFLSAAFGHHVSTFLHPFAPSELPDFFATMSALTPTRWSDLSIFPLAAAQVSALHTPSLRNLPSPIT